MWQTGRGGGQQGGSKKTGEMRVESKPPSSPDFSVKDTVMKRRIACALSAKAYPRQWHHHHHHQTSKDMRWEPQTHAWIFYSLLFTHLFIIFLALRSSLCTNTDHEVYILHNILKIKQYCCLHTVRRSFCTDIEHEYSSYRNLPKIKYLLSHTYTAESGHFGV